MIDLEVFFALLDELRAGVIALAENPDGRDAFAFGAQSGMLRALSMVREKLDELVESYNQQENER